MTLFNLMEYELHYVSSGKGPLVVLLHGFPEFWHAWRHQIDPLSENFHVVVPDLRGYGETERPPHIDDYRYENLVEDLVGLIHGLNYEKAHIVGHDWGGAVAWKMATDHPQMVDRLIIINSPHPSKFAKALRISPEQRKKSWYLFFFQIPYLPELLFKLFPKKFINLTFKDITLTPETISPEDLEIYRKTLEKPGAFQAALHYYRAAFRKKKTASSQSEKQENLISAPTLIIWGEKDSALGKELTEGLEPLFSGPFHIHYMPDGSHWVNEEKPAEVNTLLLEFLTGKSKNDWIK